MKKFMLVLTALALISVAASAQRSSTAREDIRQPGATLPAGIPGSCSPCLWYSGDTDPSSTWDADWNGNTVGVGYSNQVWVPFVAAPDSSNPLHKHVLITSVTFNEVANTPSTSPPADFAGMSYAFRTGVFAGNGGLLGKHGGCFTTTVTYTGVSPFGYNEYSFTCYFNPAALPKVAVGTLGWVNVLPKFNANTIAYLDEVQDNPAPNQFGWSDDYYNSFLNGLMGFTEVFSPATSTDIHFGEFSVAIAGNYTT